MSTLLIKNIRTLVSCDSADTVYENVDLYAENGFIKAIGASLDRKADKTIDASHMLCYPGLINTHHHLYQQFSRNLPQVQNMELFDWLRIDHFIGFANYYSIPASCPTAREGKWVKAPGKALFKRVERALPALKIIAEDLGEVGPRVRRLIHHFGYPGMKVIEFGFDSDEKNPHFPGNIVVNSVAYTGTHDNDTVMGWWEKASEPVKALAMKTLPAAGDICEAMIECVFASPAQTAIVPMQDFLKLGGEARMNYPGTVGGNWLWRMRPGENTHALAARIRALGERTGRVLPAEKEDDDDRT